MASLFPWNDFYALGIVELDAQHKNLIDIINELHGAIHNGRDRVSLSKTFQALIDDVQSHFGIEENLLKTHAYPGYEEHRKIHGELLRRILDAQRAYLSGSDTLSDEITVFAKIWLSDHILRIDRKFIPYLKVP